MPGRDAPINPDNFVKARRYSVGTVLDLGCGNVKLADVTVDADESCDPDIVHDLDEFPYPFDDESFDTVWLVHVLEHLEYPDRALEEAKRIASRVVVIVPIGERGDPDHRRVYLPEDIEAFDADHVEISRMGSLVDCVMMFRTKS